MRKIKLVESVGDKPYCFIWHIEEEYSKKSIRMESSNMEGYFQFTPRQAERLVEWLKEALKELRRKE